MHEGCHATVTELRGWHNISAQAQTMDTRRSSFLIAPEIQVTISYATNVSTGGVIILRLLHYYAASAGLLQFHARSVSCIIITMKNA